MFSISIISTEIGMPTFVIPAEMRKGLNEGDKLVIIKNDSQIIMKKASKLDKNMAEDIELAKRTEEAWHSYDKGKFKSMDSKDFLKELEKW